MVVFKPLAGFYLLQLALDFAQSIAIARSGNFYFPAGDYLYAGSAFGPGGIQARLNRHLKLEKKKHWHIDFLRPWCTVRRVYACNADPDYARVHVNGMKLECAWSQALLELPGARIPAPGFGSSDCRSGCPAHLVFLPKADQEALYSLLEGTTLATIEVIL